MMKLLSRRSRDQDATSQPDPLVPDQSDELVEEDTESKHQWTGATAITTKAFTALLWCVLAAGPAALVLHVLTPPPPVPVVAADTTDVLVSQRASVSGFAEDMVVTWLSTPRGQEKLLDRFVGDASSVTLPEKPWVVSAAATTAIDQVTPGVWSTTVAVTVDGTKKQPTARRYFQVPVRYLTDGALRAQTLPAPVAGPASAAADRLSYQYQVGTTDPVGAAAADFLSALLVGGDVARYVSPDSTISPIDPAPYTAVSIDDVMVDEEPPPDGKAPSEGELRHLMVTATASAGRKQDVTVQYALSLAARDGRWEVKSLDPAPVLADVSTSTTTAVPTPDESPTQTPAPSAPATNTTN